MSSYLTELAYKKVDAIDRCFDLGEQFIKHFNIVAKLGKADINFKHHCQELQAWYDKAKSIKLKATNRYITKSQLWDWFFTTGQCVEDIIVEPYQDLYEDFCFSLLLTKETVYEVLQRLL